MKRWFAVIGCSLGVLALMGVLSGKPLDRELKRGSWHSDYAPAREEARRTGKPLFVVFRCQP